MKMNKLRNMTAEDWKLVPLAMLGIAEGIGKVILKPFVMETVEKARHIHPASITYYVTGEENEQKDAGPDRHSDSDS